MLKTNKFAMILGLAGALAGLPNLAMAQKDPDAAGVAEAIRFEKAKQAAADRQARIEAGAERDANTADRMAPQPKAKSKKPVKSATAKTQPPQNQ